MFCDEVLELVDAIATGDVTPEDRVKAHLAGCTGCRQALEQAQQIDRLLQSRQTPPAPAQFTARIMGRLRRERWRREQFLDRGFNFLVGGAALAVLSGAWFLVSRSGLSNLGGRAISVMNSAIVAVALRVAPSLLLYVLAAGVLATALGVWWWAEREPR